MTATTDVQKHEKKEMTQREGTERTQDRRVFVPRADIYETDEAIHVIANMAGVDEDAVDITLERNELTIRGRVAPQSPDGMSLLYSEYAVGDYERRFVLSEEIDREGIDAVVRDGVLDLTLPKSKDARSRRIPIKSA